VQIVGQLSENLRDPGDTTTAANPGADRSPMVNEALRIFGGAVRNVRRDNG
jgi:hypothetical protein